MPQAITSEKLQGYINVIKAGGVAAVGQVYADLYAQGYNYAGWAEGVAEGNSITGLAALHYMDESYYDEHGSILSDAQVDKIRVEMALRTLDGYFRIARDEGGGVLSRDLKYDETKAIHEDTFKDNNLSLDNWTLNIPMELIRQKYGDETVERLWEQIRDTGGDGLDALLVSSALTVFTAGAANSENEAARQQAEEWLDNLLSVDAFTERLEEGALDSLLDLSNSLSQIGESIRSLLGSLLNNVIDSIFSAADLFWGAWENVSTRYSSEDAAPGTPLEETPVGTGNPPESAEASDPAGSPANDGGSASSGGSGIWGDSEIWIDPGIWGDSDSSGDSPPGVEVDGTGYTAYPTGDDDTSWSFPEIVVTPGSTTGTFLSCALCDLMPSMGGYSDGIGVCSWDYYCGDWNCCC